VPDTCLNAKKKKSQFIIILQDTETSSEGSTEKEQGSNPWMRTVTVSKEDSEERANTRNPSYKVDVVVQGVKTRGFLDHGAQLSVIRKDMLPAIKKLQGWTADQCHQRNLTMIN